ncbi:phosphatase PAP2 family protein [Rhodococcus sp. 27YEA15]|uniref:phosphatase PAP2 family protein n=1 Tax=Rhodococcus sp. 27YEA15 TaxID=3156259 RepID=UPI003C7BDEA5
MLDRPAFGGVLVHNSFPSGTATAVAALATALWLAAPGRWRTAVAMFGSLIVIGTSIPVIALKWHRPSEVIGALTLVACFALAASAFSPSDMNTRHMNTRRSVPPNPDDERLTMPVT